MDFEFTPVDNVEKVPEPFRGMYQQGEPGQFIVNPAFAGAAAAVVGLNKSLKAARADAQKRTPTDLTPLADFGADPASIRAAVDAKIAELQEQLTKGGGDAKANLAKIREELAQSSAVEIKKYSTRNEALQNQLYGLLVENSAVNAVAEAKGVPELLLPFIKNQVKVIEEDGAFNVYVVDASGDQRFSSVTGQKMTIKELVAEMKGQEKFGRLFESEADRKAGGGKPPGSGRQPVQRPAGERTANEKIAAGIAAAGERR